MKMVILRIYAANISIHFIQEFTIHLTKFLESSDHFLVTTSIPIYFRSPNEKLEREKCGNIGRQIVSVCGHTFMLFRGQLLSVFRHDILPEVARKLVKSSHLRWVASFNPPLNWSKIKVVIQTTML